MNKKARSPRSSKTAEIGSDEASRLIKKLAAKQRVRIKLSEGQLEAIMEQWIRKDPRQPAEIQFYVGRRAVAKLKVASYSYWGDTCCA